MHVWLAMSLTLLGVALLQLSVCIHKYVKI